MKIVFMGTPDFSVPVLENLIKEFDVTCVYTQPPKPKGRGHQVMKTPIHICAEKAGIEVRHPKNFRAEQDLQDFEKLDADVAVVAAYGLILPKRVLNAHKYGAINIHASTLPRWRGAAPIQRVIEAGDKSSGVTIMQMDEGLDTGDMLLKGNIDITDNMTAGMLHDELSKQGAELIIKTLKNIDNIKPEKQDDSKATYAKKIAKSESKINFDQDVEIVARKVRSLTPFPGAFFEYKGERFKVIDFTFEKNETQDISSTIVTADSHILLNCLGGSLRVNKIQRAGKKTMTVPELLNGFKFEDLAKINQ